MHEQSASSEIQKGKGRKEKFGLTNASDYFVNSVNSVKNYFFFEFFPPDFLESPPPLDFLSDFLLEDFLSLLSFLSLPLLSDPFLPFFGFSGSPPPPPPDGAPPPPPPPPLDATGGGGGLEIVMVAACRPW